MIDPPDPGPRFPKAHLSDVRALLEQYLGTPSVVLRPIPSYTDTIVVEAQYGESVVILKAADPKGLDPSRIALEAWARERVRASGVPAPAILAVDSSCSRFPAPYLVMEKAEGKPLATLDVSDANRRSYMHQLGSLLRTVHQIEIGGCGGLDEAHYLATGEIRGEEACWYDAVASQVLGSVQYLRDSGLIDRSEAEEILILLERSQARLQAWERQVLLHGDLGLQMVFVDEGQITGLIDWGNRWAGDPIWDLVTFDWEGGRDFRWLLEGYGPELPISEIMKSCLPLYTIFQAVPWVVWCDRRGYRHPLHVLSSITHLERKELG